MADHPILFSGPMVRALLEGRKTQTRRIVSPQNFALFSCGFGKDNRDPGLIDAVLSEVKRFIPSEDRNRWFWADPDPAFYFDGQPYHFAKINSRIGDRFWVRENFAEACELDDDDKPASDMLTYYKADGEPFSRWLDPDTGFWREGIKWRPSIHMPRAVSRLTLTITDVRLQRLQEITEEDALAEGVHFSDSCDGFTVEEGTHYHPDDPRQSYRSLWNTINGDTGPKSWDANPWVLAYSFNVRHGNIDAEAA